MERGLPGFHAQLQNTSAVGNGEGQRFPALRQPRTEAEDIPVAAQTREAVDDVGPCHGNAGDVQTLPGVAVVVVKIQPGGIAEEMDGLIHLSQLRGQNGMNGRRQGGFVDGAALVEVVIDALDIHGEGGIVKIQEHQYIRLLDHIRPVDAVVGPVLVQWELTDRDGADVRMGQVEEPVVLLKQPIRALGQIHMLRNLLPAIQFRFPESRLFPQRPIALRLLRLHPAQHLSGIGKGTHTHVVGVSVVVDHHVELVRAHDAIEAVQPGFGAAAHPAFLETGNLQQHLGAKVPQEILIVGQMDIVPDSVCNGGAGLQLKTGVLPQRTGLVTIEGGNGIAGTPAVQHFGPFQRHGKGIVAKQQQSPGRCGVCKEIERKAAGFGVPEGMAVVSLAGQTLGADIMAHTAAVVGLGKLKAAEADALLLRGNGRGGLRIVPGSHNLNIGDVPICVPIVPLGVQRLLQRDGFAFLQGLQTLRPKHVTGTAVIEHHNPLVDVLCLSLHKRNGAAQFDASFPGHRSRAAGKLQNRTGKDLLIGVCGV